MPKVSRERAIKAHALLVMLEQGPSFNSSSTTSQTLSPQLARAIYVDWSSRALMAARDLLERELAAEGGPKE